MSKIEKLTAIRDEIIDRLVTKETIEKTKKSHSFKDPFLKSILKFMFLKPFKLKEIKTVEDSYFTDDNNGNMVKQFGCVNVFFTLALFIISCLPTNKDTFTLMCFTIITVFTTLILVAKFEWIMARKKTNKQFNPKNIETIKRELFDNYNEKDISSLLGGNLSKKELIKVLIEINKIVDKEELLDKFEKLKQRKSDDITEPYNLISTIDKIIEDLKEEK